MVGVRVIDLTIMVRPPGLMTAQRYIYIITRMANHSKTGEHDARPRPAADRGAGGDGDTGGLGGRRGQGASQGILTAWSSRATIQHPRTGDTAPRHNRGAGAVPGTKIVQGWPKLWTNFRALIGIFSQSVGPSLTIWASPAQFSLQVEPVEGDPRIYGCLTRYRSNPLKATRSARGLYVIGVLFTIESHLGCVLRQPLSCANHSHRELAHLRKDARVLSKKFRRP
jgi:hypothetical protein